MAARVPLSLLHLIGEKIARREHCVAIVQVSAALAAEGFQLAAARVPLCVFESNCDLFRKDQPVPLTRRCLRRCRRRAFSWRRRGCRCRGSAPPRPPTWTRCWRSTRPRRQATRLFLCRIDLSIQQE